MTVVIVCICIACGTVAIAQVIDPAMRGESHTRHEWLYEAARQAPALVLFVLMGYFSLRYVQKRDESMIEYIARRDQLMVEDLASRDQRLMTYISSRDMLMAEVGKEFRELQAETRAEIRLNTMQLERCNVLMDRLENHMNGRA